MEYLDLLVLTAIVSVLYIGFAFSLVKATGKTDAKKKI